jgi:hypothetical protein
MITLPAHEGESWVEERTVAVVSLILHFGPWADLVDHLTRCALMQFQFSIAFEFKCLIDFQKFAFFSFKFFRFIVFKFPTNQNLTFDWIANYLAAS